MSRPRSLHDSYHACLEVQVLSEQGVPEVPADTVRVVSGEHIRPKRGGNAVVVCVGAKLHEEGTCGMRGPLREIMGNWKPNVGKPTAS